MYRGFLLVPLVMELGKVVLFVGLDFTLNWCNTSCPIENCMENHFLVGVSEQLVS